jgi:hypothetical protein
MTRVGIAADHGGIVLKGLVAESHRCSESQVFDLSSARR